MCCTGEISLAVEGVGVPTQCQGLILPHTVPVYSMQGRFLSITRQRETGRKTLRSNVKGAVRGSTEPSRFQPSVSECICSLKMISLKFGSSHTSPHPHFPFPVLLLPHSHSTKVLGAL